MIQENLKVLRLKKGMSQEELAVRIHVVRQTVSKWEKGLSVPDAQTLIQITQALEVPVSAFLGETIQAEKEEDTLQIMAKKLEEINTCLAERSARTRRRIRTIAIVMILLAFAGIVLLLLFSTGLLHQPPSGSQCNRRSRWGYRHSDSRYQLVCVRRGNGSLYLRTYRRRNFIAPIKTVTEHRAAAKRLLFCVSGRYDS